METFVFCATEKIVRGICIVFSKHVLCFMDFFDKSLNIVSSILLQSGIIIQNTYFSPVYSFVKNFHDADFEPYVNPGEVNMQHLFRLSEIGQMPLHKCRNII